jgi:hypothetical protein
VAPEPDSLTAYACRLGVDPECTGLGDSGYVRLEEANTRVIFDAGPVGPDYQPGHAHCDTLSFEASHRGRRILVNSGISTYEPSHERQRQRGTAAHNTVRIDGREQSEIWAAFRVARRARPLDVRTDSRTFVEAAHDGYSRLPRPVIHRRRLELRDDRLLVIDTLHGRGRHEAEFFFHLYPGERPEILLDPEMTATVEDSRFHPALEQSCPGQCVVGRWSGRCPATFTTLIAFS